MAVNEWVKIVREPQPEKPEPRRLKNLPALWVTLSNFQPKRR